MTAAVAVEKQLEGSGGASRRLRAPEAAKFCESKRLEYRRRQETGVIVLEFFYRSHLGSFQVEFQVQCANRFSYFCGGRDNDDLTF